MAFHGIRVALGSEPAINLKHTKDTALVQIAARNDGNKKDVLYIQCRPMATNREAPVMIIGAYLISI
ncbi:MAG: hypothetical protein ACJAYF_002404 [Arenicella sp.]|jgi:hypothetical protein